MDKKLSDNEIVKALDNDCLCVVYGVDCESCPLREKDCKILPEAIKDLIHRLQSENKELRTESDRMVAEHLAFTELAEKANEQQKAEIAELKAQCSKSSYRDSWKNKFFKAQEEIERLTEELEITKGTKNRLTIFDRIEIHDKAVKDTAKEILDEVSKHYGGAWLVELYNRYGVEV